MAVRMGEMMVVVRAQDFASRTLHKVSGELAGMSRQQALARRGMQLHVAQAQRLPRLAAASARAGDIRLIEQYTMANNRLVEAQAKLAKYRYPGSFAGRQMAGNVAVLEAEVGRLGKQVDLLSPEMRKLIGDTRGLGIASATTAAEMKALRISMGMAAEDAALLAKQERLIPLQRLQDFGHALSGIGRTMQLFGAVGLAALGGAAAYFGKFNEQATLAATQTVTVGQGFAAIQAHVKPLQEAIYGLMKQFPASGEEMAKSAYDIYSSMQVTFGGGLKLLKTFNQLAVATGTDLLTATNAGITALNNFGGRGMSVARIIQLMTATVHYGRMRLSDFNTMLNKVAPAAASAGMNLKDVAGAMALITTRQPSQQMGATGISRLIQVFQDPDFQKGVRQASGGMVDIVKAGGGLKPLPTIINQIAGAFKEVSTKKGAIQLFRELTSVGRGTGRGVGYTIFAQRAWTFLFKNLRDYNILQGKVTGDTKDFSRSLKAMMASPGVRMQVLVNQLRLLGLEIGEAAIPYILKLGDAIQRLVRWFEGISPHTKNLIAKFAVFASAGSLLAGVLLGIAGPLIAIYTGFRKITMGLTLATAATKLFGGAMRALPFLALGILVTELFGVTKAIKIMAFAWIAWKGIAIASTIAVATQNAISAAATAGAWEAASAAMKAALASTGIGLLAVAAGVAAEETMAHWDVVRAYFKAWGDDVGNGFQNLWHRVASAAKFYAGGILKAFGYVQKQVTGVDNLTKTGNRLMKTAIREHNNMNDAFTQSMNKYIAQYKKARAIQAKKDGGPLFSSKFWKDVMRQAKDTSGTLDQMYNNVNQKETELARARKSAMREARQQLQQEKQTALQTLSQTYASFHQQNEQAMGTIFGGPTMQGIFGNVFSSINDTLRQFGIQIAVPFSILRQDMDQQMTYFKRWRGDLDKLLKRGVPKRMLLAIAKLGPEAIPMIEGLLGASPKQLSKYVSDYKTMQKQINTASQQDFNEQLAVWRSHGKKAMWAILQGADEVSAPLQDKWKKYIDNNFGTVLKSELSRLYGIALTNAMADNPIVVPTSKTRDGTKGGTKGGAGRRGGKTGYDWLVEGAYRDQAAYAKLLGQAQKIRTEQMVDLPGSPLALYHQQQLRAIRAREAKVLERIDVEQQMIGHRRRGEHVYNVTYGGDTVTVHADGATVASVVAALKKKEFARKHRHRNRSTVKP